MNLRAIGCNVESAIVELREKLAFDDAGLRAALAELHARYGAEAVILGTCNRVELYLARPDVAPPSVPPDWAPFHAPLIAEFLAEIHGLPADVIRPHLYEHADAHAVRHLFRVAASLDSVVVGEGQIAGQVKEAYETAQKTGTTGPLLNALFPAAARASKRVRTETRVSDGHVSVSSAAIDYIREVFERFTDKTVLVIGAGKMARLTLKHLTELNPARVLVTNRSPAKALEVAQSCGGTAVPWEQLDDAIVQADIVLSTTGAAEPIMPRRRFDERVRARRKGGTMVIFDMAVPRDFDPRIGEADGVYLFNVDDLNRVREQQLAERRKHVPRAEAIVTEEVEKFVKDWNRRQDGPVIGKLTAEIDRVREEVIGPLLEKLNGKLGDADRAWVEGAFRLFQNKLLHGPIAALQEASRQGHGGGLREALMKLFGLKG